MFNVCSPNLPFGEFKIHLHPVSTPFGSVSEFTNMCLIFLDCCALLLYFRFYFLNYEIKDMKVRGGNCYRNRKCALVHAINNWE